MMRPEDEPLVSPVPFGGVRPPSPQVNPDPRMRGQVSRDPRGWRTTLPDISLGGATTPQPTPQTQQPALPGSLDEFVPQTLPTPSVLPKYQGFSEEELALWEPLWMLSRGYTLPDDEFSRELALMGYREQFKKEADLIAFDTYRKNLELRAQHDQRVRQLFAPVAQDFNTVFSSEAIQQALREVIAAYKSTNPKISWNKLSPDAKRREILRFMQQGRLPTLKRFAEQWKRLKDNFFLYRQMLDPADQMVVSELDGVLGGSFEDFILKYLTLNDPEEEEQERQLRELRRQHELMLQMQREYPDLYRPPVAGGGGGAPGGGLNLGGGGLPRFGGGGSPSFSGGRQGGVPEANIDFDSYFNAYLSSYDRKTKRFAQPNPVLSAYDLSTLFTGSSSTPPAEVAKAIRNYVPIRLPNLVEIVSKYPSVVAVYSQRDRAFANASLSLKKAVAQKRWDATITNAVREYAQMAALAIIIDFHNQYDIRNLTPQQRQRLANGLVGTIVNSLQNDANINPQQIVVVNNQQMNALAKLQEVVGEALLGVRGMSYPEAITRTVSTGQTPETRLQTVRNAIRRDLTVLRDFAAVDIGGRLGSSIPTAQAFLQQDRRQQSDKVWQHIRNTADMMNRPDTIAIPLEGVGFFNTPEEAVSAVHRLSTPEGVAQLEGLVYGLLPNSPITSQRGVRGHLQIQIRLGTYKPPNSQQPKFAYFVVLTPSAPQQQKTKQGGKSK